MFTGNANRTTLSVTPLEDRTNPVTITVTDNGWNPAVAGTMPWAIAQASAAANPGQDIITLNYVALGTNTPVFNSNATQQVKEGVVIQAGGGGQYATFKGTTPFDFTHDKAGAAGAGLQSEIRGGVFDTCKVAVANTDDGGAIRVNKGQVTTFNTRFANNTGLNGGAAYVAHGATLVLDGDNNAPNPDPLNPNYPEQGQGGVGRTLFKKNVASLDGGGIKTEGSVILKRVWFVENKANRDGGGIEVSGSGEVDTQGPAAGVFADAAFFRNKALRNGGGMDFYSTGTSTLAGVQIGANDATASGSGVAVFNGTVDLIDSTVSNNIAAVGSGGGVYVDGGNVNATRVTFQANFGGPWVLVAGTFVDTNCIYL